MFCELALRRFMFRQHLARPRDHFVRESSQLGDLDAIAAIRRARLYVQAGADAIFPEALETPDEFATFAKALEGAPLLANNTEFGRSPNLTVEAFGALGYCMVLFPLTAFRVALKSARDTLADLKTLGHQRERIPEMLTRAELYDLLGYKDYEVRDLSYFG